MNYEEFIDAEKSLAALNDISIQITKSVSEWFSNKFGIDIEENEEYPLNGFKLICHDKEDESQNYFDFFFKYGSVTCEIKDDDLHYSSFNIRINKNITEEHGLINKPFSIYFNDNFEIIMVISYFANTRLENGIHIISSCNINNKTNKKRIQFLNIGVINEDKEIPIERENNFFIDFHTIIETIYKIEHLDIKTNEFDEYPEIIDFNSFKIVLDIYTNKYNNEREDMIRKISILDMINI